MKKIIVVYWKERNLIPEFPDNCEFEYSAEKRNEIIQAATERGLSTMTLPNALTSGEAMVIYIGKGRLTQS